MRKFVVLALFGISISGCVHLEEDDAPFSTRKMDEHAWKIDQELMGAHDQTMKRATKWFDDDDTPVPARAPAAEEEKAPAPVEKKRDRKDPVDDFKKKFDNKAEKKTEKKTEKKAEKPAEAPRGFLGIQYSQAKDGVHVDSVIENTAAQMAGLAKGDVITSVNGKKVESMEGLANMIGGMKPGAAAVIAFSRGGAAHEVKVTLGARPAQIEKKECEDCEDDCDDDDDDDEDEDDDD